MQNLPPQAGIDVSAAHLDVCLSGGRPFRVSNDEAGLELLGGRLPAGCAVHLEASGGHERLARRSLGDAGFRVETHDPLRAKRLAQALSGRAKTDALDARRLADLGSQLPAQAERTGAEESLRDLSRAADALRRTAADLRRRARAPGLDAEAGEALEAAALALVAKAEGLERSFAKRAGGTEVGRRAELARSVPGVGPALARVAACELPPDLSGSDAGRLASFAGLAPMDDSSGKREGARRIAKGCARLKAALYMPALSCVAAQGWAADLYRRLRAKGKAHRQALVAVMTRLLLRIAAVLKRGTPWEEKTPPA